MDLSYYWHRDRHLRKKKIKFFLIRCGQTVQRCPTLYEISGEGFRVQDECRMFKMKDENISKQ